ncbi:cytochrome c family protein [Candidatus Tisiphia endosymbiont of Beris chalybata]|uniref:c-type cytochrome n=1 Tax=Candidatus Tisiphia endosymbiont of Beris chalybata TaxID=3066262 RepID=UPI00312C7787
MSGIELNKIVASILLASLISMMVGFIANILYKPLLRPEARGYSIPITDSSIEDTSQTTAVEPVNIEELIKKANAEAGSNIIKKCLMCHTFDKNGLNKVGPNLWNVVGSKKAKVENYKYSTALSNIGGIWDEENLFHFLHKPNQYLPGTKMTFAGLNKPQDIADVIVFLKTFAHD